MIQARIEEDRRRTIKKGTPYGGGPHRVELARNATSQSEDIREMGKGEILPSTLLEQRLNLFLLSSRLNLAYRSNPTHRIKPIRPSIRQGIASRSQTLYVGQTEKHACSCDLAARH